MKAREIADYLGAELVGDGDVDVHRVADLSAAVSGDLAFVERPTAELTSGASCVLAKEGQSPADGLTLILVKDPRLAFARIAAMLHAPKKGLAGVHPSAIVSDTAELGSDVSVGALAFVGDSTRIGAGTEVMAGARLGADITIGAECTLHPNVVIEDGCSIGDRVILHAGVVIGADGFGYVRDHDAHVKFPQIGIVMIEDDVEIGANTCVDRGALGETRIGAGTKIDNLVQIAHNVQIGRRVIIAAQTGISGSTVIEDDCLIGGQVGMGDHARVQSGAIIGSQAGVLPGKIVRPGVWWGTPVQPLDEYKRQNAHVKGLARLKEEIKDIKRRLKS